MEATVAAALLLGLAGVAGGLCGPMLIARIPEPAPDPDANAVAAAKTLYTDIATMPGLRWWLALAGAVCGGVIGTRIGWHGALMPWVLLVPLGLVLSVVDARTRLLPTWVIAPSYGVLVALVLLSGVWDRSMHHLLGALLGWLGLGGFYVLLWLIYPKGMGYGDVRLSGLLGIALGALGWHQVLVGGYAGVLLGGVGGFLLSRVGVVRGRTVPFGPFMVAGAFLGAAFGGPVMVGLGY